MNVGVILYGPPASGKDTITRHLSELSNRYRLYSRVKHGTGRIEGYRMVDAAQVDRLRRSGSVLWENSRYGATYFVERDNLVEMLDSGLVPVLHLGQVAAVESVRVGMPGVQWLSVYLTCPRDVAEARIIERATGDTADRLQAWDETAPLINADLRFDTSRVSAEDVARTISARVENWDL